MYRLHINPRAILDGHFRERKKRSSDSRDRLRDFPIGDIARLTLSQHINMSSNSRLCILFRSLRT